MNKGIIPRSSFFYNVLTLFTGTTVAQALPILFYPLITRLYTPDDFAVFGLYLSIVGILSVVATARFELAIMLPTQDSDSANVVGLSVLSAFVISLLVGCAVIVFNDNITLWLNNDSISFWLYVVPFSIFIIGLYQSVNYYLLRKKAFKASAINRVSQKVGETASSISLGFFKVNGGLVISEILGRFIMGAVGFYQLIRAGFSFKSIELKEIKRLARRYWEFPIYNGVPSVINALSLNIPLIFVSNFFTVAATGFFNLSRQLLAAPLSLISRNLSQVLLQRIAEKRQNNQAITSELYKILLTLAVMSFPILLILAFFAPYMFKMIFGAEWEIAGSYTQILVIGASIKFIVSPLSVIFTALEKLKIASVWQVFYFICICSLVFLLKWDVTIYEFFMAYVAVDLVSYLIYLLLIIAVAKQHDASLA